MLQALKLSSQARADIIELINSNNSRVYIVSVCMSAFISAIIKARASKF